MNSIKAIIIFVILLSLSACETVKYVPQPYPVKEVVYVGIPDELLNGCAPVDPLSAGSTNGQLLAKYYDQRALIQCQADSLDKIKALQPTPK